MECSDTRFLGAGLRGQGKVARCAQPARWDVTSSRAAGSGRISELILESFRVEVVAARETLAWIGVDL